MRVRWWPVCWLSRARRRRGWSGGTPHEGALRTGIRMTSLGLGMTACQFVLVWPGCLRRLDSEPGIDFALSVGIVPCGHDCAVGAQAEGVR